MINAVQFRRSRAQVHVRARLVPGDSRSAMVVGHGFRRIASLCGVPRRTDRHCRISQASNSRLLRTAAGRQGAPILRSLDVGATEAGERRRRRVERWIVPSSRKRQGHPESAGRTAHEQRANIAVLRAGPREGPTRVGRDSHYHPQTGTTMIARLRPAAAASHQATASPGPGEAPSSEPVEDDGRSEFPRRTPPRDQNQRRRAEKTTVRPLSDPHGLENDE